MPSIWRCEWSDADRTVVHRTLSRWLDSDHHAKRKPWSWTAQSSGLIIGLLNDGLVDRLTDCANTAGTPVQQVAKADWAELRTGRPRDCWQLEFVSPVTFRRGNRFLPWPSPSAVFGSLRAAWRTFGAPTVGDLELDLRLDPLIVTAFSGSSHTERVTLHRHDSVLVGGFVGIIRYALDGTADTQVVDTLVRLAPFSGVGACTTRGFGGVRICEQ